jgi:hypothetical protein
MNPIMDFLSLCALSLSLSRFTLFIASNGSQSVIPEKKQQPSKVVHKNKEKYLPMKHFMDRRWIFFSGS